jgi:hypothetical protein
MADIFVSYAHADRERVQKVVERLKDVPLKIWWDPHLKKGDFSAELEKRIADSDHVLIAWSRYSKDSLWVKAEAQKALELKQEEQIVQIHLDEVSLPMPFNALHAIGLFNWRGDPSDAGIRSLIEALGGNLVAHIQDNGSAPDERTGPPIQKSGKSKTTVSKKRPSTLSLGASKAQEFALWLAPTSVIALAALPGLFVIAPELPDFMPDTATLFLSIASTVLVVLIASTALLIKGAFDMWLADRSVSRSSTSRSRRS